MVTQVKFRRVLAPLDGSAMADQALPLAVSIASLAGARLELASVVDPREWAATAHRLRLERRLRAHLQRAVVRIRASHPVRVSSVLLRGAVVDRLVTHTRAHGVDLIVMATHGSGPASRAWFGSVADELLRRATVPVLLVRPRAGQRPRTQAAVPRRVVIPLDGSSAAERIIAPASSLAMLWGADCRLLRAVPPDVNLQRAHARREQAVGYLERVWTHHLSARRSSRWNIRAAVVPDVARWILDYAGGRDDLIALTTSGRAGVERLLLGSVADKIIRGSAGPVLVQSSRKA